MYWLGKKTCNLWTVVDYVVGSCLGAITLLGYVHTLCPGVYPGPSASSMANVLGVLPGGYPGHPVWLAVMRLFTRLPFADPVGALNLLNAGIASAVLVLFFLIMRRFAFHVVSPIPSLRVVPFEEEVNGVDDSESPENFYSATVQLEHDTLDIFASLLGALIASFVFGFSVPFWRAATSLSSIPFDLLLVFAAVGFLGRQVFHAQFGAGVAAAYLAGLLAVESALFGPLSVILIVLVVMAAVLNEQLSESLLLLLAIAVLAGAGTGLLAAYVTWPEETPWSVTEMMKALQAMSLTHLRLALSRVTRLDWFFLGVLPILGFACSAKGCFLLNRPEDEVTRWKWIAVAIVFTVVVAVNLLNLPKSITAITRHYAQGPVLLSAFMAAGTGLLFIFWFLSSIRALRHDASFSDPAADDHLPCAAAWIGHGFWGLILILVLQVPTCNVNAADGRKALFADRLAREVLTLAAGARCLVTDGVLDHNLMIANAKSRLPVLLCPLSWGLRAASLNPCAPRTAPSRLLSHVEQTDPLRTFLAKWMLDHRGAHGQLAFFCNAQFLHQAGLSLLPRGLLYSGVSRPPCADEFKTLLSENIGVWQRIFPDLQDPGDLSPYLLSVKEDLRHAVSRLANNTGVALEQNGLNSEADIAYTWARTVNPSNLTATLNQFGVRIRSDLPGSCDQIADELERLSCASDGDRTFATRISQGGLLIAQQSDLVLPKAIAFAKKGGAPAVGYLTLLSLWLPKAPEKKTGEGLLFAASATRSEFLPVLAARMAGRPGHAEALLRRLLGDQPDNLAAWALLAELMLERKSLDEVEQRILPAMQAVEGGTNSPLVAITRGLAHLHAIPRRDSQARRAFREAVAVSPLGLPLAGDLLLTVSLRIGDARALEQDAHYVIQYHAGHARAHAVLGSLRLSQKRYEEAEIHLTASLAAQVTAGALNDLAETYRQLGKLPEAEKQARAAVRLEPSFLPAWDSLGCVLRDSGRHSEAEAVFACVKRLNLAGHWQIDNLHP